MQAAILKHRSILDEYQVANLYKTAREILFTGAPKVNDPNILVSNIEISKGVRVVTCTDAKTGLFVQLSGAVKEGPDMAVMAFGHKYCQEVRDGMRQNIATKIW